MLPLPFKLKKTYHSPATHYLGEASLGFNVPTSGEEYLISQQTFALPANYTYEVSAVAYDKVSGWDSSIHEIVNPYIDVVDAATGISILDEVPIHTKRSDLGYFYFGKTFRLEESKSVKIRVGIKGDVTTIEAGKVYIDDVNLQLATYYGIATLSHYNHSALPDLPSSSRARGGFKVLNGTIQNTEQARGFSCDAMRISGAEVSNVTSTVYGTDSKNIYGSYGSNLYIHDNTFHSNTDIVSSRHQQTGANIKISGTNGLNLVKGNKLLGSPQYGVNISGDGNYATVACGDVIENEITNAARVTQCYMIGAYASDMTIRGNILSSANGNGIHQTQEGGYIFDNTITSSMKPNQEYGWRVSGKGIELRKASYAKVFNNKITTITDATNNPQHAMVFRQCLEGNQVYDNTFVATTDDNSKRVAAFRYYHDESGNAILKNNTFASNSTLIMCEEGYSSGAKFIDNTFRRLSDPSGITHYAPMSFGWLSSGRSFNAGEFYNSSFEGDTSFGPASVYFNADEGKSSFSEGWSLNIQVKNTSGNPVAEATVTIENSLGESVYSGQTDSNGDLLDIAYLIQNKSVFADNSAGIYPGLSTPVVTAHTPHQITVTAKDYKTGTKTVTMGSSKSITISLEGETVPNAPNNLKTHQF